MFTFTDQDNRGDVYNPGDDLITEPDGIEQEGMDYEMEQSVAGAVAGATVPLGAGPNYPNLSSKKPKSPADVSGRAFGGAKPVKKKKH